MTDTKIDNYINSLKKDYDNYTETTKYYENMYQNSIIASEHDKKSWLRSITMSNTRREDIKFFINILENLKVSRKQMEYQIIDNKEENKTNFIKKCWGHSDLELSKSDLNDILNGKALAIFDGEYTAWITVKEESENGNN